MEKLLLVDDDLSLLESLKMHFEDAEEGGRPRFEVLTATSGREALEVATREDPALVILDMMLPDQSGLSLLPVLKEALGQTPLVIVTAFHDMETTIRAMKAGAFDYIHKPFPDLSALDLVVERALQLQKVSRRTPDHERQVPVGPFRMGDIVGTSAPMQALIKEIGRVSASHANVLVQGESGTGKELIARAIHDFSHEDARPFVGINCSAIVDSLLESELFGHEKGAFTGASSTKVGKFEYAGEGTVFLDEIGDMSLHLQAKLLRVLQEREFERVGGVKRVQLKARIVAATHRDLPSEVAAGRFREDLYQRLSVVTLRVPPLRERREDIPQLVHQLLERINEKVHKRVTRVPAEVLEHLSLLPWRGNVRELENVLTRAVVLASGDVLLTTHLPYLPGAELPSLRLVPFPTGVPELDVPGQLPTLAEAERILIQRALLATQGHKGKTCAMLGISRPTLERKLKAFGLTERDQEGEAPGARATVRLRTSLGQD